MDASLVAALSLGFWLGLRHAFDADHLAAVSTIVSEHKSLARSSLVGTFWGLGHTASLLAVGMVVISLRVTIPEGVAPWLEMPVAVMLIGLGAHTVWKVARERGVQIHAHAHTHDGDTTHAHLHLHDKKEHDHRHHLLRLGRKPFIVGLVHGLAGSAALMLAVLTTIQSVALGVLYIVIFGLGSVGGMLLMSALIGLPFAATARRFSAINGGIRVVAGLFSMVFGLMLAWELLREIGKT